MPPSSQGVSRHTVRYFDRKAVLLGLGLLAVSVCSGILYSESVTLHTYYPAPSGIYTQMITTGKTYLARDGEKVGIGTIAPTSKLHVVGDTYSSGNIVAGQRVYATNGVVAAGTLPGWPAGWSSSTTGSTHVNGGAVFMGTLPAWPGMSLYAAGNAYVNDLYLASVGRWASAPTPVTTYYWSTGRWTGWTNIQTCSNGEVVAGLDTTSGPHGSVRNRLYCVRVVSQ
ncbi:MAG: hypothetical protein HY552_03045 [Elusimicrobia bacterium]|nr:hypothetical protein [Elusimicrobiota bacterium]